MPLQTGEYTISTNKDLLDIPLIHQFLSVKSYWAQGIPLETVKKLIQHSLTFGVYWKDQQAGFARVITDYTTIGYLADVFITEEHRGKGLSKWLVETILAHPDLQGFRRFLLATRDAHTLYEKFGFKPFTKPENWMEIHNPDVYKKLVKDN